jgi:hypothetical protein
MDYSPDKVKCFGPGIEETVVPKQETHFTIDTTKVWGTETESLHFVRMRGQN